MNATTCIIKDYSLKNHGTRMYSNASNTDECIMSEIYWVCPSMNPYIGDNRENVANILWGIVSNSEIKY